MVGKEKKLLNYLRERVRRATKKAKDEQALKEHLDSLDTALAQQERVTGTSTHKLKTHRPKNEKEQPSQEQPDIPTTKAKKQSKMKIKQPLILQILLQPALLISNAIHQMQLQRHPRT